jgi:alcohol dehydrogenase class IV
VARIFDSGLENENDETASIKLREFIVKFLKLIDMLNNLNELKVPENELPGIADDSVKLPDYTVNPRIATRNEIYNMLKECYNR